jgi:S-DNA-T family DNA segregation ATPase FtsK/SpoIIIE
MSTPSNLPIGGKVITVVVGSFCQKPVNGDDTWTVNSIGVATNSVVATDGNSAILIGEPADLHVATKRKETLIEGFRATQYGEPVRIDDIERNIDPQTGEVLPMPMVQKVIREGLSRMKSIGAVDPLALVNIGKVASAAGALSVELFQPQDGDQSMLGFRFKFFPEDGHVNLFTSWDGPIKAVGVFKTTRSLGIAPQEELGSTTETEVEAPKPRGRRKAAETEQPADQAKDDTVEVVSPAEPVVDLTVERERGGYVLPPLTLLDQEESREADSGNRGQEILNVLGASNVTGRVVGTSVGPTVTLYRIEVPAGGALRKVGGMADELAMQLAVQSVRIQAPIPGERAIGIEVPNRVPRKVSIFEMTARAAFLDSGHRLLMALGQDVGGKPVYANLSAMPHLLIGGATNSGKSIGVASILGSLLLRNSPADMRLVLVDPKRVELSFFEEIPHLACPVVTDMKEVAGVLRALVREMERRYEICKEAGVRNIDGYNSKASANERIPYVVLVIDELADLMQQRGEECEPLVVSLAQKARAVGIHLIVATQRPSADIITGLIKANVPSRIAFSVASGVDSRVILDAGGAERLVGKGDMLFNPIDGGGRLTRLQGAYIGEDEVLRICRHWRDQAQPRYLIHPEDDRKDTDTEVRYAEALRFAVERRQVSTSMIQRKLGIGFQAAATLLQMMERRKAVGPQNGPKPREVLLEAEDVDAHLASVGGDAK